MSQTSVINLINTGTSANSGDGDSLRTAFSKINTNLLALENSYVAAGVASFNGQGGIITFTSTQIAEVLGFMPYSDANPLNFVTSSTVQGFALKTYVDDNFVNNTTIQSYPTIALLQGTLQEYVTLQYLTDNVYITAQNLSNNLGSYVTTAILQSTYPTYDYLQSNYTTAFDLSVSYVSKQDLGNFVFSDNNITNNRAFTISASPNSQSGISLGITGNGSTDPLLVYNTASSGVVIQGPSSSIAVDVNTTGIKLNGNIKIPMVLETSEPGAGLRFDEFIYTTGQSQFPLQGGSSSNVIKIQSNDNISITGNTIQFNILHTGSNVVLTPAGLYFKSNSRYNEDDGYYLPTTSGSSGTVLVSGGPGVPAYWSNAVGGSGNVNSDNAIFTTATVTKTFTLGTDGLTFNDTSVQTTAYGNQQVYDYLPQYGGVINANQVFGPGTDVNLIANGLSWTFGSNGTTLFPGNRIDVGANQLRIKTANTFQYSFGLEGTFNLPVLSTEPVTKTSGMVAIANGTSWNPAGTGVETMVVYLAGQWKKIA